MKTVVNSWVAVCEMTAPLGETPVLLNGQWLEVGWGVGPQHFSAETGKELGTPQYWTSPSLPQA